MSSTLHHPPRYELADAGLAHPPIETADWVFSGLQASPREKQLATKKHP